MESNTRLRKTGLYTSDSVLLPPNRHHKIEELILLLSVWSPVKLKLLDIYVSKKLTINANSCTSNVHLINTFVATQLDLLGESRKSP